MTNEEKPMDKTDMSLTAENVAANQTVEQWLAICKEAGLQIDPETAEVECGEFLITSANRLLQLGRSRSNHR
jgi:hypothetical protein